MERKKVASIEDLLVLQYRSKPLPPSIQLHQTYRIL